MSDAILDKPRVPRAPDQDELRREWRALFWKRLTQAAFVAAVVLVLGFSAWNVVLIRATQVDNRTTLDQAKSAATSAKVTADRIEDCTTPGGTCFERAQRQTSGAVAGINTITVRAAACMTAILKQYPDGQQVNVDAVASQIQQCIRTTTVTIKPERVVPAPAPSTTAPTSGATGPKGTTPHPAASSPPSPQPSNPPPANPIPTALPSPTASPGLIDSLCDALRLRPCPLH